MRVTLAIFAILLIQAKSLPRRQKLSSVETEWSDYYFRDVSGPGSYAFGYDVEDAETNNVQFRSEEKHPNGTVEGSYGYMKPDGSIFMVHYVADEDGYRAVLEDSGKGSLKNPSAKMAAALDSLEVFKEQSKFEQRGRPVDATVPSTVEPGTKPEAKTTPVLRRASTRKPQFSYHLRRVK